MNKPSSVWILLALMLPGWSIAETLSPSPLKSWEQTEGLPASRQGKFPVMMPKYEGIDQLILLSSRHLVVVTHNIQDVYDKVNELSGGAFTNAMQRWEASEKINRPDWAAYKGRHAIFLNQEAQAREAAGERRLDYPVTYNVSSPVDAGYTTARHPSRVTRMITSLGGDRVGPFRGLLRGALPVFYAHYSYLELPSPLQPNAEYTVALADGRKATFVYDETRSISQAIKVNQIGYVPGVTGKYAYLAASLQDLGPLDFSFAREFKVVDVQSGEVVFRGPVTLREKNPRFTIPPNRKDAPDSRPLIAGEDIYQLDLTGLTAEGNFFITIPGVGRSWTFRHAADTYGEAFYTACRALYHQRCGIPLTSPFTPWTRPICHTNPVYESENLSWPPGSDFKAPKAFDRFDVVGGTLDTNRATATVRGGWHDAADWDRNNYHYLCVFDLLNAYELVPSKFTDGQLNLPESGNGIPDLLDEAEFGLEVWKRSMTPAGGVAGMVETSTHATINDARFKYAFTFRTRWDSLIFATAAAQYAALVKPFSPAKSSEYQALALKAYAFGTNPSNSLGKVTIHARHNRGSGSPYTLQWEETDTMINPYLIAAKCRLALLTGDNAFLANVPELCEKILPPYQWPNSVRDYVPWLYFPITGKLAGKLPPVTVDKFRKILSGAGMEKAALNDAMPYRISLPRYQDYWLGWGASTMYNYSRMILIANAIEPRPGLTSAAIQNADFMLGANPLGLSFTTGLGYLYPIDIQHETSEMDGIMDPIPGITVYGITGGAFAEMRNEVWRAPTAAGSTNYVNFISQENQRRPTFRQFSVHPHLNVSQCEFTVAETCASSIFTFAMLLPDGWKPSDELKHRTPRQEAFLFGYYYLP